jgi:hypothetical protein
MGKNTTIIRGSAVFARPPLCGNQPRLFPLSELPPSRRLWFDLSHVPYLPLI